MFEEFEDEIEYFDNEFDTNRKCDFCVVGDCSLCDVGVDQRAENGEIIC